MMLFHPIDVDGTELTVLEAPAHVAELEVGRGLALRSTLGAGDAYMADLDAELALSRQVWQARRSAACSRRAQGTLIAAQAALGGNLQAYVDRLHRGLIAGAVLAATGAAATGWLLLPARRLAEAPA